jgi:hypothetical protein
VLGKDKVKDKLRVMIQEDFDEELNAMNVCVLLLKRLTFDQQWRVLNYIVVRLMGRSWSLGKPASDSK